MHKEMKRQQKGVMLIEALVGILIFSIGILAIMGMQAISIKSTIEAKYRTEASFLANQTKLLSWRSFFSSSPVRIRSTGER